MLIDKLPQHCIETLIEDCNFLNEKRRRHICLKSKPVCVFPHKDKLVCSVLKYIRKFITLYNNY